MKTIKYLIIFLAIMLPVLVFAHGAGQTLTIDKGDYQIDIDLDTETPRSGTGIRFDFDLLLPKEKGLNTNFDYIWVRIRKDQKTIFAGGIGKPDFGPTGFTTTLPEAGTYVISLRFQNEKEELVEGESSFKVMSGAENDNPTSPFFNDRFFVGLIIGLALVFSFRFFR